MKRNIIHTGLLLLLLGLTYCSSESDGSATSPDTTTYFLKTPAPVHNSIVRNKSVDLSWTAEGNPESYTVYFGPYFRAMNVLAPSLKVPLINVPRLSENITYYWRVTAHYPDTSVTGPIWTFMITDIYPEGSVMVHHETRTETPHSVFMNFQVFNLNNDGISGMKLEDFEYYEDGASVHEQESDTLILRGTPFPYTLKTVLMIDNSTSINGTEFARLQTAAYNLVNLGLLPGQEVALYSFSGTINRINDFSTNESLLKNNINAITTGDATTDLYGAVIVGADLLTEEFSRTVAENSVCIIFTDGKDTQQRHTLNEALTAATGKHFIMVSLDELNEIDLTILRRLGTDGFYYHTAMNLLHDQLREYQLKMDRFVNSFYEVEYYSPVRGNSLHEFLIMIKKNLYTGIGSSIMGRYNTRDFF